MRTAASVDLRGISVDRDSPTPLYQQLCDAFRRAIVERRLHGGQRVPATRSLARELGISRIPVLTAFEQLLAEGYFESRIGSGTFVSCSLPGHADSLRSSDGGGKRRRPGPRATARRARSPPGGAQTEPWLGGFGAFRMSEPALDHFPFGPWSRLVARHARDARRNALNYGSSLGHLPLRRALAAHLSAARGVRCDAGQILIVSGSQQALSIAARVLLDPGEAVWVEEPGYAGARNALAAAGARLVPVPVDHEGLNVAAGRRVCPRARAAYVTPSHQYPLGATMSATRRLQLLDWAQATGAWVIEDDYDSEYRYDSQPIAALQGLDRDARVVYVGTFSKVLFPALRVGYLVVPPDLVERFSALRRSLDICPPTATAAALAEFIAQGHFARHLRRTAALYRERRSVLIEALHDAFGTRLKILGAEAGMHLVARRDPIRDRALAGRAAREGLWVMPLSACYLGTPRLTGLVLGYGGTAAMETPRAVRRLWRLLDRT
jgi:GntR family transcriptional regulator/MocR family aminotransferase